MSPPLLPFPKLTLTSQRNRRRAAASPGRSPRGDVGLVASASLPLTPGSTPTRKPAAAAAVSNPNPKIYSSLSPYYTSLLLSNAEKGDAGMGGRTSMVYRPSPSSLNESPPSTDQYDVSAARLASLVSHLAREMTLESYASAESHVFTCLFTLINTGSQQDALAGIAGLVRLLGVTSSDDERKR